MKTDVDGAAAPGEGHVRAMAIVHQETVVVGTEGRGAREISQAVERIVGASRVGTGLCHVFVRHTSASLMLCENADPDVRRDLETFMSGLVPDGDPRYRHAGEGPDDMPAHVRSVLTQTGLCIPVVEGKCGFGVWQGVYLWEHRRAPHRREVVVTVQGTER